MNNQRTYSYRNLPSWPHRYHRRTIWIVCIALVLVAAVLVRSV